MRSAEGENRRVAALKWVGVGGLIVGVVGMMLLVVFIEMEGQVGAEDIGLGLGSLGCLLGGGSCFAQWKLALKDGSQTPSA